MAVPMLLVLCFVQNVIHFVTYLHSNNSPGQHDRSRDARFVCTLRSFSQSNHQLWRSGKQMNILEMQKLSSLSY